MSQYLSDNPQRFYPATYDYTPPQNNYFVLHSQRNPPVREGSLNRNNSVSSSLILKPGKIQQNLPGKIRRQSSMRNSADFKENDPYIKNSYPPAHTNKVPFTPKDQNDIRYEHETKNPYCNPMVPKKDKIAKDLSRQKIPNLQQTRQTLTQSIKSSSNSKSSFYQQQYQMLNEKFIKMESQMKDNINSIAQHKIKIQKLEELCHSENQKEEKGKRHARSISNPSSSGTPTFKELSDIMSLIQETKSYQIKNSQEYRKMIEEFRSTILEFRQQLNKTAKKNDVQSQIHKIKNVLNSEVSASKKSTQCSTAHLLSWKSKEAESMQKIQRDIHIMKLSIEKLQEQSTSIKADMVKFSVRDKKMGDQFQSCLSQVNRKLQSLEKQTVPFSQNQQKRGHKYEGNAICFKVSQQLMVNLNDSRKVYKPTHMTHSSVMEYEEGNKLGGLNRQSATVNEKTYFIDKEGYLLDKDNFYLLNDRNQQIKLSLKEIETLRKLKVLE